MAEETHAAIKGAFKAGTTEVVVRDSHGDKRNLLPADVDPRARLLRGQGVGPKNMMEGIDATFAAVVFIGYHAKAGTPGSPQHHPSVCWRRVPRTHRAAGCRRCSSSPREARSRDPGRAC